MIKRNSVVLCSLLGAFLACGTSPDVERSHLRTGLNDAEALAKEIEGWRGQLAHNPPATLTESIAGFQERADAIADQIDGLSDEATAGVDLKGVQQALNQLVEFPTDGFEASSPSARESYVQQFAGLAGNLRTAVQSVQVRLG